MMIKWPKSFRIKYKHVCGIQTDILLSANLLDGFPWKKFHKAIEISTDTRSVTGFVNIPHYKGFVRN